MDTRVYIIDCQEMDAELRDAVVNLALSVYIGEPCRICGKPITKQDLDSGAVFAGCSEDNLSRSAHKECWGATHPIKGEKHGTDLHK